MDLVIGGTGNLGGEICRRLVDRGRRVRSIHRDTSDPEAVERLESLGIELVPADLSDPSTVEAACAGVDSVLSTATAIVRQDELSAVDLGGQKVLVDAAIRSGVQHFVFVSVSGRFTDTGPLVAAKREVERRIVESGCDHTILRPTAFLEAWLGPAVGFDYANARATIYGDGTNPISYIAVGDVAEFAVQSLERPEARNAVIELGGPEPVTPLEAVRIFEEVGGRAFELQHLPEDQLREQVAQAQDPKQRSFAALMLELSQGDAIDMRETLATFPIQLTSVRDYAERALAA